MLNLFNNRNTPTYSTDNRVMHYKPVDAFFFLLMIIVQGFLFPAQSPAVGMQHWHIAVILIYQKDKN